MDQKWYYDNHWRMWDLLTRHPEWNERWYVFDSFSQTEGTCPKDTARDTLVRFGYLDEEQKWKIIGSCFLCTLVDRFGTRSEALGCVGCPLVKERVSCFADKSLFQQWRCSAVNRERRKNLARQIRDCVEKPQDDKMWDWYMLESGRIVLSLYSSLPMAYRLNKKVNWNGEKSWEGVRLGDKEAYGIFVPSDVKENRLQIIPEGPFNADNVKVGDWVWVEGVDVCYQSTGEVSDVRSRWNGWHRVIRKNTTLISGGSMALTVETEDGNGAHGNWYLANGSSHDPRCGQLHYYPPEKKEKKTKKVPKESYTVSNQEVIDSLRQQIDEETQRHEATVKGMEERIDELETELKASKKKVTEFRENNVKLSMSVEELKERNKQISSSLEGYKHLVNEVYDEWNKDKTELEELKKNPLKEIVANITINPEDIREAINDALKTTAKLITEGYLKERWDKEELPKQLNRLVENAIRGMMNSSCDYRTDIKDVLRPILKTLAQDAFNIGTRHKP